MLICVQRAVYLGMPKQDNISKKMRGWVWFGLVMIFVHFSMTSLYTIPAFPAPDVLKKQARSYMWPMFHQGWQLFAPDVPGFQHNMSYRASFEGAWSEFLSPSEMPQHNGHPRVSYITHKIASRLGYAMNDPNNGVYYLEGEPRLEKVQTSAAYEFAIYYCRQNYKLRHGHFPDSLQIEIDFITTPDFFSGKKSVEDLSFTFPKSSAK